MPCFISLKESKSFTAIKQRPLSIVLKEHFYDDNNYERSQKHEKKCCCNGKNTYCF